MPHVLDKTTHTQGQTEEEVTAFLRLIAAAPETAAERDRLKAVNAELVVALRAVVAEYDSWMGYNDDGFNVPTIEAARAAIAKATT